MTKKMRWKLFYGPLILGFLLSGCFSGEGGPTENTTALEKKTTVPFWGFAVEGRPTAHQLFQLTVETAIVPDMIVFFVQWPAPDKQETAIFPTASINCIGAQGAIPVLTWEPFYRKPDNSEHMIAAETICNGAYDEYLARCAAAARTCNYPFLIRLAHEMNLRRYHWSGSIETYGPGSPERYRRLYRYVVNLFQRHGVSTVLWVFCPNAESVPDTSAQAESDWNRIAAYYPGAPYVDVLGIDGYNWGSTRTLKQHGWESRWQNFETIFREARRQLQALAPEKPLFIFETGCVSLGGERTVWLENAFTTLEDWRIRGICWFQAEKENDWRLTLDRDQSSIENIRNRTSEAGKWLQVWSCGHDQK